MTYKPHAILFLLGLVLTAPAVPAHAVPITIDGVGRSINVGVLTASQSATASSLGLFGEVVTLSGVTPNYELLASASQASNISLISDNLLIVNAVGLANTQTVFLTPFDPMNQVNYFANSMIGLSFTVNNWASFDTHSSINSSGNSFAVFELSRVNTGNVFSEGCSSCGTNIINRSGILSPGTYGYFLGAFDPSFLDPVNGNATYASSFVVQIVPEPPSLLLLSCGIAVLAGWRFRRLPT